MNRICPRFILLKKFKGNLFHDKFNQLLNRILGKKRHRIIHATIKSKIIINIYLFVSINICCKRREGKKNFFFIQNLILISTGISKIIESHIFTFLRIFCYPDIRRIKISHFYVYLDLFFK